MPHLVLKLQAEVDARIAGTITSEGQVKLANDENGLYVWTSGKTPRIYVDLVDAYIEHSEPAKLGGRYKATKI